MRQNKLNSSPEKLTRDTLNMQDLKAQNKELHEKVYSLKLKYEELDNEHNLLKLNNQFQQKAISELEQFNQDNLHLLSNPAKDGEDRAVTQYKDKIQRLENRCLNYENQIQELKQTRTNLMSEMETLQENYIGLREVSRDKTSNTVEKHFDLAVQKVIMNLVDEVNIFINKEVDKNQDSVEGMEMSCKLEEMRSQLIDYLGNQALDDL